MIVTFSTLISYHCKPWSCQVPSESVKPLHSSLFTNHFIYYQMKAKTSPPTLSFLASLSVITPLFVEMIAVPKPPRTFGSSSLPAYTRRPGLEILLRPVMIFSFLSLPYFNVIRIVLKLPISSISYLVM